VNYKKCGIVVFLIFVISVFCSAQEEKGGFWGGLWNVAPFGEPFWADMHSTIIRVEVAYATNSPDYDWGNFGTRYRFFIFANLGVDIPIWAGAFADGKYGLSLTLPFMMDVWFDRFEWETSPIINTSYRFGAFDIGFIYRLDSPLSVFPRRQGSSLPGFLHFNIYNWAMKLSLFKHESTHIGDELSIRRKDLEMPITRVDVAYNFAELVFTLNDPDSQYRRNHGFKFGFLLHYGLGGWYTIFESEAPQPDDYKRSRVPFELYAQYQYQSAMFSRGFQIITSVEYRLRERYKYPFSYSGKENDTHQSNLDNLVNCFDFLVGIRHDNQKSNYFSKTGIGARYYFGINPYGQFRSMPQYRQFGLMVLFE
jgi:hypothetical protein